MARSDAQTPMMAQYHRLKAEAGDALLFYRMGDFFELFFDDAKVAAACLDIALTKRGADGARAVPMCGVPVHSARSYLARPIKAGIRSPLPADQSPAEARKARGSKHSQRAIVRLVTPGTLTEEALLAPAAASWLAAVAKRATMGHRRRRYLDRRFELVACNRASWPRSWRPSPAGAIADSSITGSVPAPARAASTASPASGR
jgi:DNA mismatch repair protein MutS